MSVVVVSLLLVAATVAVAGVCVWLLIEPLAQAFEDGRDA